MNQWTTEDARAIAAPDEVRLATRRGDGGLRSPRTIWIVRHDDRVFVRSTNGRAADWFRATTATSAGQVRAGGAAYDVAFTEITDEKDLVLVDAAYRAKYGRYASIVDHLEEAGPRAATLEVHPA